MLRASSWWHFTPGRGRAPSAGLRSDPRRRTVGSISSVACSIAALRGAERRRSVSRLSPYPIGFWRIYAAGKALGRALLSNGTAARYRAWTRRSPMLPPMQGLATMLPRTFCGIPRRPGSCSRDRYLGSRGIPWDDDRDAFATLRSLPSRLSSGREKRLQATSQAPHICGATCGGLKECLS